jgi:hypothetical protein
MGTLVSEHRLRLQIGDEFLALVYAAPQTRSPRGCVVMLHGGPGGQKDGPENLYGDLAQVLGQQGIASVRFDFRGVAESTGRYRDMTIESQVADYEAVWSFVRGLGFARVGVIGESYGATIALTSESADPDVICLLWPAVYFLDVTFAPFVTDEKMATARRDGFTIEDGVEVGLGFLEEVLAKKDVEDGVRRIKAPTLLIHGTADTEVPVHQSERVHALIGEPKKLVTVDGGDHMLVRPDERNIVNSEVADWLEQYL